MNDLNVIDRFLDIFIRYIDSGFGLLGGDVAFLTTVLIGIDITLAGLFWAMEPNDNVLGKLLKKILLAHVVVGTAVYSKDAGTYDGKVNGFPVSTKDGVTIGPAKVTKADIKCGNGVIHVIDAVLLPKS